MCSIGEDDFGDFGGTHSMIPTENDQTSTKLIGQCKKCGAENVQLLKLNFRDLECEACFLLYARHKFRATLGSTKVLPREAKVLLIYDGSSEAIVLLDMLHFAQTQNNFKRLHCNVRVLYIDETILSHTDQGNNISTIKEQLEAYSVFESYIIPIGKTTEPTAYDFKNIENYLQRDKQMEQMFLEKFQNIRSLTSKQDYLKYQKNQLITTIANEMNYQFAFLPDISTTLASQLLTAIALGRGGSASYDVALTDERCKKNVKIIRPLRDLNQQEVDTYLRVRDLKPLTSKKETYGSKNGPGASLQNLTQEFVENLQQNYSSTVSTVFRCSDKIAPKHNLNDVLSSLSLNNNSSCTLCSSPMETNDSKTLLAIEFSRLVSNMGTKSNDCNDLDSIARENLLHTNEILPLCHACKNIENDDKGKLLALKL